ncbi:unnamed protein product [Closterium sp. NIES-54]
MAQQISVASPCPACRVALLADASPCPACRVALLAVVSPCPVSRVALLAFASPCCPRAALLPVCRPTLPTLSRPAARAPPCWQPNRCTHRPARDALLSAALLADALLPAKPYSAPPCCSRRPAAARPAARNPAGRSPTAHAPPCWQPHRCPHRPGRAALLLPALLARAPPDHEGRPIQFDTWLDELQLYLLSDSRDSVSLFDHTSGASLAPPATADSATRPQWLTRDAAACLAVCNHLRLAERTHSFQNKTAKALYDAIVARFSSSPTTALGRLMLPYLFPELDHFFALDPTDLTVDLLEKHLLAAETSVVAVGAARGTPRTPFFEGCSPSPLAPSYASAAAIDILGAEDVGAASALSGKRRRIKGKGGKSGGGGSGGGGGGGSGGGGGGGGGGSGGSGGGSGGFGGSGGGSGGGGGGGGGSSGSGGGGSVGGRGGAVQRGGSGGGQRQQQQRQSETPTPQQLREWFAQRGASRARSRWLELLRSGVDIFALDYDAILSTIYALSVSAEGDYYLCVPPDPCIEAAALGARESALPVTTRAEALHTFTHDSGASCCFVRASTTLTPLPAPVPVRLADPSGGPVLARSSIVMCPAVPSGSHSGLHLPSFSTNLVSTAALQDSKEAESAQVSVSGPVAALYSCRLVSHQTVLCHHRLGHPSLPRLRGMHSRLLVSGLPRSLPPLPLSPAPPCLPCVEGRQRAAPHSSSFPLTTAPLQTLHMDVWGPARVNGQGRERYFLLSVSRSASGSVRTFLSCIFTLTEVVSSPPSSYGTFVVGRAFSRFAIFMEVARTSMIHAAAPHFLWPFAVWYAAHQLNLWPHVSLPETSPTLHWTGKVGDALVFRVSGSRAFVRATSADQLSSCAIPCVFLDFPPNAPGWQFYHPTSHRPAPSGVSLVDPLFGNVPVEVAVDSGAARGAASGGAAFGGTASGGAEPASAEPGVAESEGAEFGVWGC